MGFITLAKLTLKVKAVNTVCRLLLILALLAIVFSSCTSTKMVIDKEINREYLSDQLHNGDHIKVTTIENAILLMDVIYFDSINLVGANRNFENVNVPYAEIDTIELKKVNTVKVIIGSLLLGAGILLLIGVSAFYI